MAVIFRPQVPVRILTGLILNKNRLFIWNLVKIPVFKSDRFLSFLVQRAKETVDLLAGIESKLTHHAIGTF